MSSKKGTKRFWTAELRELAGEHLEAKAAEEAALAAAAKQLFARFSAQYAIWRNAVSCAAELDCLLSLARASSAARSRACARSHMMPMGCRSISITVPAAHRCGYDKRGRCGSHGPPVRVHTASSCT